MLSKSDKLQYCSGCHCHFYNGNNPYNIKECWSLKDAKLVLKKRVSMSQYPPWKQTPVKVLDCYREDGYVMVDPKINC
jgi:hypothetical protein